MRRPIALKQAASALMAAPQRSATPTAGTPSHHHSTPPPRPSTAQASAPPADPRPQQLPGVVLGRMMPAAVDVVAVLGCFGWPPLDTGFQKKALRAGGAAAAAGPHNKPQQLTCAVRKATATSHVCRIPYPPNDTDRGTGSSPIPPSEAGRCGTLLAGGRRRLQQKPQQQRPQQRTGFILGHGHGHGTNRSRGRPPGGPA